MKTQLKETLLADDHPQERPLHYIMWQCGYGGIELSVRHYIRHFHSNRQLYVRSLRPAGEMLYDAKQIHYSEGKQDQWSCYSSFYRYCCLYREDQFHLLNIGPIMLLLCLLAGVRQPVYHIRGTVYWTDKRSMIFQKIMWYGAYLLSRMLGGVHYIANSEHTQQLFRQRTMPVKPPVIYNGFAVDDFWTYRRKRTQLKKIAYIGRLNQGKNVELVIQLFAEIAEAYPELELHIAGDGPLRGKLEDLAQQSGYADRITFHGLVQNIAAFYAEMDLFVFLSAYESFGNVLAEALLTGLPILTSRVGVFNEIHNHESCFTLGDPTDYEQICNNFKEALNQYPHLADRAFALSEYVRDKFSIRHHLSLLEKLYKQK